MPLGNKFVKCFQTYLLTGRVVDYILKGTLFVKLNFYFLLRYFYFCGENCCLAADNTLQYCNCLPDSRVGV